jgi:TPR repeat protein
LREEESTLSALRILLVLLASIWLTASPIAAQYPLSDSAALTAGLQFTCIHEAIPPRNPDADALYQHARWFAKKDHYLGGPESYRETVRQLRIAVAYGHDLASLELRYLLANQKAVETNPPAEQIALVKELIRRNIASGYYTMGMILKNGNQGLPNDDASALWHFRKAAMLGNSDGLYTYANLLLSLQVAHDTARQMLQCAAEQGHAQAAYRLGSLLRDHYKLYPEALAALHLALKLGDANAAYSLEGAFSNPITPEKYLELIKNRPCFRCPSFKPTPPSENYYLGLSRDRARVKRYKKIQSFLLDYFSTAEVTFPDLDNIVPLPPAQLPKWNGRFQWTSTANIEPPLPDERRIVDMAKARNLDPATGKPMPK